MVSEKAEKVTLEFSSWKSCLAFAGQHSASLDVINDTLQDLSSSVSQMNKNMLAVQKRLELISHSHERISPAGTDGSNSVKDSLIETSIARKPTF